MHTYMDIYIYIYIYTYIIVLHCSISDAQPTPSSEAPPPCPPEAVISQVTRPHSFDVLFIASMTIIICYIICQVWFEEHMC